MAINLRTPDIDLGSWPELTTRVITTTVKDENGAAIPGAQLTTMKWTQYSEQPGLAIVNGRDHVDVKANVDSNGLLTLLLAPADMAILTDTLVEEAHRHLFEFTYNSGRTGRYEARITVSNMAKVP